MGYREAINERWVIKNVSLSTKNHAMPNTWLAVGNRVCGEQLGIKMRVMDVL